MIIVLQSPTCTVSIVNESNGDISTIVVANTGLTTRNVEVMMKGKRVLLVDSPVGTNTYTIPVLDRARLNRDSDALGVRIS